MELDEGWPVDEIEKAEEEARASHKAAMNSYGAGYDRGYLDALNLVLRQCGPDA